MGIIRYPSVTFDGASAEADRTIDFGQFSSLLFNEYNLQVIDANGDSVPGTVAGMVSVDVYSPFTDRPETTMETVDLSTDCRKFRIFRASIHRAVFSVTGLAGGNRVVATCIRGNG